MILQAKEPQKVIVYRSQREQQADEFWWSEGYFTPTMAGDFIVGFAILAVILVIVAKLYEKFRWRRIGRGR
jgi:hypothetical protein